VTRARLGAAPEFRTRFNGLVGLRRVYGVKRLRVEPVAIGELYPALDSGRVQLAAVFTTDGQLRQGQYKLLSDPKDIFGFQNVTFVVRRSVLDAEGPAFAETLNAVSAKLSTQALRVMNAAVALGAQSPTLVARQFLRANGLA
jgi:osmoprotectant transport system substrate-binding protein